MHVLYFIEYGDNRYYPKHGPDGVRNHVLLHEVLQVLEHVEYDFAAAL